MAEQLPNKVCLYQCEPDAYSAFSRSLAHAGYAKLHKGLVNMYNPEILRKVVPKSCGVIVICAAQLSEDHNTRIPGRQIPPQTCSKLMFYLKVLSLLFLFKVGSLTSFLVDFLKVIGTAISLFCTMANSTAYQNMFVITTFQYSSVEHNEHDCNTQKTTPWAAKYNVILST